MKVIIASHNQGKVEEIKTFLKAKEVYSLKDLGLIEDIEEFGLTLEQNALIKAQYVSSLYPEFTVISDDSGLEVDALGKKPGVYSARYASEVAGYSENPDKANVEKLLKEMEKHSNRNASFKTVLCVLKPKAIPIFVQGVVTGTISMRPIGEYGFGYDPVFSSDGLKTFGQLTLEQKAKISHRSIALNNLLSLGLV